MAMTTGSESTTALAAVSPSAATVRERRPSNGGGGSAGGGKQLPPLVIEVEPAHSHSHGHAHGKQHDFDDEHDGHDHGHGNGVTAPIDAAAVRKLKQACACSLVFMLAQCAGGYYADSLALMTDAAHLLSDVASFLVSLFAIYVGATPPSATMPFGYHRAEVLGALISVIIIWVLTGGLLYAAVGRMAVQSRADAENTVNGRAMFLVAALGLVVNLVLMKILGHGHSHSHGHGGHGHGHGHSHDHSHGHDRSPSKSNSKEGAAELEGGNPSLAPSPHVQDSTQYLKTPMSAVALINMDDDLFHDEDDEQDSSPCAAQDEQNINVRAAYIHALGDFLQSLGVCLAGALIWYNPDWQIADPITTVLFSFLVLGTTYGVLTRSLAILMEATPPRFDLARLESRLRQLDAVYDCHDLRIWSLTEGRYAASVHVLANGDPRMALRATQHFLQRIGVHMQTVQVEQAMDHDFDEDTFCMNTSFSTSDIMMSVPRASTSKAAAVFTIE